MSTTWCETGEEEQLNNNKKKLPELKVKFNIIPKTQSKSFTDLFQGYCEGLVKSEPGGTVLPTVYSRDNNAQVVYQFEPRKDDVWVVTFPKCGSSIYFWRLNNPPFILNILFLFKGTTWTQELVWLLVNNCDTEAAVKTMLLDRSPFLE